MIISREFEKSIERPDAVKDLNTNFEDLVVEPSYTGPKLEKDEQITPKWVE